MLAASSFLSSCLRVSGSEQIQSVLTFCEHISIKWLYDGDKASGCLLSYRWGLGAEKKQLLLNGLWQLMLFQLLSIGQLDWLLGTHKIRRSSKKTVSACSVIVTKCSPEFSWVYVEIRSVKNPRQWTLLQNGFHHFCHFGSRYSVHQEKIWNWKKKIARQLLLRGFIACGNPRPDKIFGWNFSLQEQRRNQVLPFDNLRECSFRRQNVQHRENQKLTCLSRGINSGKIRKNI